MPASSLLRRPAFVLALGLFGLAAITTLLGRIAGGPSSQSKPVALSDIDGIVAYPALSPDGNRLAYCERAGGRGDAFRIYTRRLPKGAVTPLSKAVEAASEISPAWSQDGARIAFLRVLENKAELVTIPSGGGNETQVAELTVDGNNSLPALSWSRDGRTIAVAENNPPTKDARQSTGIVLVSLADGSIRPLTNPPEGQTDSSPAFSPDGSKLAFARGSSPDSQDIYVADANGANARRLTFDECPVRGIAWTPQAAELVYSATRNNRIRLYRVSIATASPREVIGTAAEARFPTLSLIGNRLAYTESPTVTSIWRRELGEKPADSDGRGPAGQPLIHSSGREKLASYSPDGARIADISDQTGFEEIWISDANGGNRARITNLAAQPEHPSIGRPVWSPDGKQLLFTESTGYRNEIWKVAAEPNAKAALVVGSASAPAFSHDGKSIFYSQRGQIFKAGADGSNPKQLTDRLGNGPPVASPDGRFVYYRYRGASIWRVPAAGGEAETVIDAEGPVLGDPEVTKDGIYYLSFDRFSRNLAIMFYNFADKKTAPRFPLATGRNFNFTPVFSISPDGKYALYTRVDQAHTNLMLVEAFR